jgi:pyruvate dehydrogenase E2 component (dihydrolipoamide acetyltransferase)
MPALSPTMKQGNLVSWVKKEGDTVSPGDVLAEIETDKATVEFESQDDGILARVIVPAGTQDVPVGALIALLAEEKSDVPKLRNAHLESEQPKDESAAQKTAPNTPAPEPTETSSQTLRASSPKPSAPRPSTSTEAERKASALARDQAAVGGDGSARVTSAMSHTTSQDSKTSRIIASPYARKIALESGVDLAGVQGTGPQGRIVAADLEAALQAASQEMAPELPLQLFVESKQNIPHYQLVTEIQLDHAYAWLSSLERRRERSGAEPIELEDVLIKAVAVAARNVPQVNASFFGTSIREYSDVDVLLLPSDAHAAYRVIPRAHTSGLGDICRTRKQESSTPTDAPNRLGTIGLAWNKHVLQEMAIIVPPHAAMVVVGKPEQRVISGPNGAFQLRTYALVTASFDHRVVDGAVGAQFMTKLQQFLHDPLSMLE